LTAKERFLNQSNSWCGPGVVLARNLGLNYDLNSKTTVVWDNQILLTYGLSKIKGDEKQPKQMTAEN
jgi:hypothetical protein